MSSCPVQKLSALQVWLMSWFREPQEDYEKLYAFEAELSDLKPYRFELLSIWRLARDEKYAKWTKKIGTCQIALFGMEKQMIDFTGAKVHFRIA